MYLPVRAAHTSPDDGACHWHPPHLPPAGHDQTCAVIDYRTRLGGERRDRVCRRCLLDALCWATREADALCWVITPTAHRAQPGPLGQPLGAWPPAQVPA